MTANSKHDGAGTSDKSQSDPARPKVVIVGAGFGGLDAARALRDAAVDITILDRHNYHCFQPLLYQVATATLSPADIAWPIRTLFRRQPNVTVLMADVTGVDPKKHLVLTDSVLSISSFSRRGRPTPISGTTIGRPRRQA
jgi:NADH dehydrogenase FAD-containing subunit